MKIGVLGINHKLADLSAREILARAFQKCFGNESSPFTYVLLLTCNRIELYFSSKDLAEAHSSILCALKNETALDFDQKLYSYFGFECFLHLAKVAAGFDSAILAETEIQGQVKMAYEQTAQAKKLPSSLHYLFQKSLKIAKAIRTKYALGRGMPDIEHAIFQTGTHFFKEPKNKSILFIGSSAINQKVLEHLKKKGCANITLCNRSKEKGEPLSAKFQIPLLPFSEIGSWRHFDWIIMGTKAPHYLIQNKELQAPLIDPKLIIDLSLPRNADPCLAQDPRIQLLNIDQINRMLKFRRKWIDAAYVEAEKEISFLVDKHTHLSAAKCTQLFAI